MARPLAGYVPAMSEPTTDLQPEAPRPSLVENEGVNADSRDVLEQDVDGRVPAPDLAETDEGLVEPPD